MNTLSNEKVYGFMKTAMGAAVQKHQVLSANLANIDTPGYKSRDLNFEKVLQDYEDQEAMMPRAIGDRNRSLPPSQPLNFKDYLVEESSSVTERFDGNNVNLDEQVANLAKTRGRFSLATMFVNHRVRLLSDIIQGR